MLDFKSIHGRALTQLVSSKFLANHKLEDTYEEWIKNQPVAKFTGYVHELMAKVTHNLKPYLKETINKQFYGLIETAKKNAKTDSTLIVVRDVSGSMSSPAKGLKMSSGNVAKALALYFSEFLTGAFANSWIEFSVTAELKNWKGNNPVDKWINEHNSGYCGNTNFQTVISLFVRLKRQGIAESEFPTGILCISDGEFDPADLGVTNVAKALSSLYNAGFSQEYLSKFKIILWNIPNSYYSRNEIIKFETYGNQDNVYYFSGYDGAIISFLTGIEGQKAEPKNAEEVFTAAMEQEIMSMLQL